MHKQDGRPAKNETGSETKLLGHRGQEVGSLSGLVPTQTSSKDVQRAWKSSGPQGPLLEKSTQRPRAPPAGGTVVSN